METTGITVNRAILSRLTTDLGNRAHDVANQAYEIIGREINLGSPKQLQEVLFDQPTDRDEVHKNFIACIRGEADRLHAPVEEALKATLAINGAYTSAGRIQRIGWEAMVDITEFVNRAAAERKLFSEMGAPWAYEGHKIDMATYDSFDGHIG